MAVFTPCRSVGVLLVAWQNSLGHRVGERFFVNVYRRINGLRLSGFEWRRDIGQAADGFAWPPVNNVQANKMRQQRWRAKGIARWNRKEGGNGIFYREENCTRIGSA